MKTITKTGVAQTAKGTVLQITVTEKRGLQTDVAYADGWNVPIKKMVENTETILSINGKKISGYLTTVRPTKAPESYGYFLGVTTCVILQEDVYNILTKIAEDARIEAETDQEWIEYQKKENEKIKNEKALYNHEIAVEKMMTLNGHTF